MDRFLRQGFMALSMLAISLVSAAHVVERRWFWQLYAELPAGMRSGLAEGPLAVLRVLLPDDVQQQERQLEFFMAWLFVAIVLVLAVAAGLTGHSALRPRAAPSRRG